MKCTISKVTRQTDETKGTSACVIKGYIDLSKDVLLSNNKDIARIAQRQGGVVYNPATNRLNIIAVGKTAVKGGDAYNEIKGLRIAECQAKKNLFKAVRNINLEISRYLTKKLSVYVGNQDRYTRLAQRETQHIGEIDRTPATELSVH